MAARTETNVTLGTDVRNRGFGNLPCPRCGEDAAVMIRLDAFGEDDSCACCSCEAEFSLDNVADIITKWTKVIKWLETAPNVD